MIRKLGKEVSRVGFGGLRLNNAAHGAALRKAIASGINLIDTAANFEKGASETIIGDTVQDMISKGEVSRDSLTIVSKSGYLLQNDVEKLDASKDFVQVRDQNYHSISPRVMEMQISQSLDRLRTNKLDIFMINAPERMLMAQKRAYSPAQLYKDMEVAFQHLDTEVAKGRISGYGICSNTLADPQAADHVSLPKIIEACAKKDNLVAVETPFNFFERQALVQPHGITVADICEKHQLFLMTNRPLTAIYQGQIRPFVNHTFGDGTAQAEHAVMEKMSKSLEMLTTMESDLMSELPIEQDALATKFIWAQVISENLSKLSQNHFAARHFLENTVLTSLKKDVKALLTYAETLDEPEALPTFQEWTAEYQKVTGELCGHLIDYAYVDCLRKNNDLDRILGAVCPLLNEPERTHSPISVKMLRIALANEQIGSVLTGMRQEIYVDDALKALEWHKEYPLHETDLEDLWRVPFH
ncbi:NADP-dependent oxidoreductase domain-containing protein [Umbelopsis sp. AD052]|nr:NADP-dependent oxidoreductase domain-containing protein [Umbelopsis sp. AD052]